jgi:glutamine cyclotransferase
MTMRLPFIYVVLGIVVLSTLGILISLVPHLAAGDVAVAGRAWAPKRDSSRLGTPSPRAEMGRAGTRDLQASAGNQAPREVVHYRYKVIKSYPHDRRCFTQGLVYEDGFVYEGTGLYGQSALYKRDLQTGRTVKTLRLPDKYFGEGITLFGDKLIQVTWQSKVGFVYTKDTFTPLREFKYRGEGWGLTHDGQRLILSDGTATLRFLDPNTCAETGRLEVRDQGRPVERLNELEYVASSSATSPAGPRIYANIWPTDQIVIIDPETGRLIGRIDMSGLWTPPADEQGDSVLNGIAYLPQTQHLLVTGKLWPRMYEIELLPAPP